MGNRTQLTIRLLSQDPDETTHIAEDLKAGLGETAEVEVTEEKIGGLTGRAIDPATMISAIGIVVSGVEISFKVMELLAKCRARKPGQTFMVETGDGRSFRIMEMDTLEDVMRKLKRVERKPGLLGRLVRKRNKR